MAQPLKALATYQEPEDLVPQLTWQKEELTAFCPLTSTLLLHTRGLWLMSMRASTHKHSHTVQRGNKQETLEENREPLSQISERKLLYPAYPSGEQHVVLFGQSEHTGAVNPKAR